MLHKMTPVQLITHYINKGGDIEKGQYTFTVFLWYKYPRFVWDFSCNLFYDKSNHGIWTLSGAPRGFWGSPVWGLCSVWTDIISGHMRRKINSPPDFPLERVLICVFPALLWFSAGPDFHTGASSAPALVWLSNQAGAGFVFLRLRIPHPVASREERRGVPCAADSRHTAAASSSEKHHRVCQRLFSLLNPSLRPPSAGCTETRPAVLSGRPDGKTADLCACLKRFHHDTSAFELML